MKRQLRYDFRLLFHSSAFYFCILILVLTGLAGKAGEIKEIWNGAYTGGTVLFYSITQEVEFSDIFLLLIPVCAASSFAGMFKEELANRVLVYTLPQAKRKRYCCSKVFVTGISGALVSFAAVAVIYIILFILFPLSEEQAALLDEHRMGHIVLFLQCMGITIFNGMLWAFIGGISSCLFREKYVCYSAPFICYYILTEFQLRYYPKWYFLSPKNWGSPVKLGFGRAFLLLIFLNAFFGVIYAFMIRKKLRGE